MKFKVVFHPEIYNDIQEAIDWYNVQQNGLGSRFLLAIKKQLKTLDKSALQYAVRYNNIRCMPVKKFPFMVHYHVNENEGIVKVEAIFSTSGSPGIWEVRAKKL